MLHPKKKRPTYRKLKKAMESDDSRRCPRCGEYFPSLTDGVTRRCLGSLPGGAACGYSEPVHPAGSFLGRLDAAHRRGAVNLTGNLTTEQAIDEVRGGQCE